MVNSWKKLLVLDINGLLLDTYYQGEPRPDRPHDAKVNRFYVYKRAFCDEFVQFCLKNFIVGVWSSAREHNVHSLVDFIFKEAKGQLAFIWHQQHCTDTGFRHPDNKYKPVFLKELSRLWESTEPDLPWTKGDYGPSNTLLIDDSPYKAISNPGCTAIFPKTYKATDPKDNYLAGELLPYLKGLLEARNVQNYTQRNPIGEPSISPSDPQWSEILKAQLIGTPVPVRPDPVLHSNEMSRRSNLVPENRVRVPPHMSSEPQSRNTARGDKRWRRYDRIPQLPYYADNGGTYGSRGFPCGYFESGAGPSWLSRHIPNDSSHHSVRQLSGRSSDYGNISEVANWRYSDLPCHERYDDRRGSFREYEKRASGWSEEPENFIAGESWDFHQCGARDQQGSNQNEGKKKRRLDWPRYPTAASLDDSNVIKTRDRSGLRDFTEPYSFQRPLPRHMYRREESHKSKTREGGDLQIYADKDFAFKRGHV